MFSSTGGDKSQSEFARLVAEARTEGEKRFKKRYPHLNVNSPLGKVASHMESFEAFKEASMQRGLDKLIGLFKPRGSTGGTGGVGGTFGGWD